MRKTLFCLFILISVQMYSQINFEKGYFIDKNDVRTDCFIRNNDLYKSPKSFAYKIDIEDLDVKIADISNVQEFVIDNKLKYVKYLVNVDMSSTNLNELSQNRDPEWVEKTLFLRVLIDGGATLFEYKDDFVQRYFYKLNDTDVEQLIYKKYFVKNTGDTKSAVNNEFQKQLWLNMRCGNETTKRVLKVEYNKSNLTKYFEEYNNCNNYGHTKYIEKGSSGSINFKLKAGVNVSELENYETKADKVEFFEDTFFPKFGAEVEYITPFNRNKWSVYVNLDYQIHHYEQVRTIKSPSGSTIENVEKRGFADDFFIPQAGFRHYMFLNNNSSIFIGIGLFKTYTVGYSYQQRVNVELQTSIYSKFSVVLAYTLFNSKKHK